MFPWLSTKFSSKDGKKKGIKESSKEASRHDRSNHRNDHDRSNHQIPRLERSRNVPRTLRHSEEDESVDISRGSQYYLDLSSEVGSGSAWGSQSPSPSNLVSRSPSNIDQYAPLPRPPDAPNGNGITRSFMHPHSHAQPLPSPRLRPGESGDVDGGASGYATDSVSSEESLESLEAKDSGAGQGQLRIPNSRSNGSEELQTPSSPFPSQRGLRGDLVPAGSPLHSPGSQRVSFKSGQGEGGGELHIHIFVNGVQGSAPNSSFSSPVPSPRTLGPTEPTWLWSPTTGQDPRQVQSSSPTSGQNSAHNSTTGDFLLQQERISPERSPMHSPKKSPLPSPRAQSRAVSPLHPRAIGAGYDSSNCWSDEPRHAHPLPLPPGASPILSSSGPVSPRSLPPRSPGRAESGASQGKWVKGQLLGSGAFGKVYRGIHSETGDMCAIKEVELVSDDSKSKESAKQLTQEIALLSNLRHPNILHYKGSEMVNDYLYIYLELMSAGSIYKILQEFKCLKESVIRRYTRQILQGLQYLHSMNTVHRDIKAANILVDSQGRVKLADFGMAKHIKEQASPLSFKGSPYWMAPEVIMQKNTGFELAVDIWGLGCTVIEMATGKPPWSEYEGVAAMFKVTRCDSPPIPDSLSPEGKDFIRLCLQRNPADRPTASALLNHQFVQIPADGPDTMNQTTSSAVGDRSMPHDVEGALTGSYRRSGLRQSPLSESPHVQALAARQAIYPSLSAPVSPRSSHQAYAGLSPSRSTLVHSGYSTPPTGGQGTIHSAYEQNVPPVIQLDSHYRNPRRSSNARPGNPAALQVTVNREPRSDFQWGPLSERNLLHQEYIPMDNGYLHSGYGRLSIEPEQESHRQYRDAPRRLDEQVTQQLLRRPPHLPVLYQQVSSMGSTVIRRTNSHDLNL